MKFTGGGKTVSRHGLRGENVMLKLFALTTVLISSVLFTYAQGPVVPQKASKEVVEQFCNVEMQGGRLNPAGWQEARRFFVRSGDFVPKATVFVIEESYTVWDPMALPDGTTDVTVEIRPVGKIDSNLRFTPPAHSYHKTACHFKMVFTDKRWEVGRQGAESKEVTESSPRWLIDEPTDFSMVTVSTAIRYVSQQRDATRDLVIKKNAEETLAKLKGPR